MPLRGNENILRNEQFQELIGEFREVAKGHLPNLIIQGREIERSIYFIIKLDSYDSKWKHIHYEIYAEDWEVYLGLHFEEATTRDSFRNEFEIGNSTRFNWVEDNRKYKKIRHVDFFQLNAINGTNLQEIANKFVTMLEEMEKSLGGDIRNLANNILAR
jgi:hypothetical protein